jgi:hypothetical protein
VALIIGEAGIGKSRLVHRFHETLGGTSIYGSMRAREPCFRTRRSIR